MIDMICKILAPAASKNGLPYYPRKNMSMGEFFELHKKTMEHIIYPSFEQVGLDNKQYLSVLRKIRNLLDHPKDSKHVNLIRYLLKPCSFGQAVVMMEKGAVMYSEELFFKIRNSRFCEGYLDPEYQIKWQDLFEFEVFDINCYHTSLFHYTPWVVGSNEQAISLINQEVKDFCDDILGVKSED